VDLVELLSTQPTTTNDASSREIANGLIILLTPRLLTSPLGGLGKRVGE
jgi:hypothetical protein